MPIPKCAADICKEPGPETLLLEMRAPGSDVVAELMVKLPVCAAHKMNDEQVGQFIDVNWEHICMGFDSAKAARPERARTTWKWVPWIDAELLYAEQKGEQLTKVYKQ